MKIWRKDSTKPIKDEPSTSEEEFTDISQASTPKKPEVKSGKMEEIYSTKDKQVKYKRQTPLEAEEAAKRAQSAKEKLASGKAEIALNAPVNDDKIVELTSEHEEGTVIADDIIEDLDELKAPRSLQLQDVDDIDIPIDSASTLKKYEREISDTRRHDERQNQKPISAYEQIFGKPKFYIPSNRIVTKIPTYQHDSKINQIHLKAGKFTDVVESEYDEYLKSNDPTISKRYENSHRNIEPKQSLLYTLSQLATQRNAEKAKRENISTSTEKNPQSSKKPENKIKKFFRILLLLILPKNQSKSPDTIKAEPQTTDYQSRQDSKYVAKEISSNLKNLIVKSVILSILFILTFTFTILEKSAGMNMFSGLPYTPLIYCASNLLLLLITGFVCKPFIISGLKPLRNFKGNSDTAAAVAFVACLLQQIVSLFTSGAFVASQMHLYTTIVSLSFTLNIVGRIFMVTRVKSNFGFITSKTPAYAAKIYNDEDTARKMLSGTTASHSVIAYQHETDFLSDFLKISYAPDPSEELSGKFAPITIVSSVFVAIVYGIIFKSFVGAMSALAVMCCISIPISAVLTGNLPLNFFSKNSLKRNAMLSGYPSIRQFGDCDAIMANACDLYPKGSIKLNTIKYFAEYRVEDAMLSAATILKEANSPLQYIFSDMLEENAQNLPRIESALYEDKLGLVGWVNGERILIGNRKLLDRYHIYIEDAADETKYKNQSKEVTYIASSGQLIAMVVATYTADKIVKEELQNAQKHGLCLVVSTTDSNITQDKIALDYEIYYRTIKVLNTGFANTCLEVTNRKEDTSRAYLATRGKFTSLLHAITGSATLKHNLTIGLIVQIFGLILGVLLCATMVLYASVSILGVIEMLLYMLSWSIASIVVQFIKKP